MILSY